jgi:hypothetical protein
MLKTLICVCWFIAVASLWWPALFKTGFLKNNEKLISKILFTISAILTAYYEFFDY